MPPRLIALCLLAAGCRTALPAAVLLRVRHPRSAPMRGVTVDGKEWKDFDAAGEAVRLRGIGTLAVAIRYRE